MLEPLHVTADPRDLLSPREVEVLEMASLGLTNLQIAARLHVSIHAVKFHLAAIYRKLGVANRTEAAVLFLRSAPMSLAENGERPRLMDLNLYLRVIWRFWWLVLIGLIVATVLAVLSVFRIDGHSLEFRQKEKWVSVATVLVTEPDFPLGRAVFEQDVPPVSSNFPKKFTPEFAPSSRFIELANVYAELVTSDDVRRLILADGPLPGAVQAVPLVATNGSDASLPMVGVRGVAATPADAVTVAQRGSDAFRRYLKAEQNRGGIPPDQRVLLTEVRHPGLGTTVLLEGRSKTVPIVVFLTVMLAFVGLAFILENLRPRVHAVPAEVHSAPAATPVRARSSA